MNSTLRKLAADDQVELEGDAEPHATIVAIAEEFYGLTPPRPTGIDPRAVVDASAAIGADTSIGPYAVIGRGTTIGARCRIHSGVSIGRNCTIGDDATLHANAVLYDNTILGDGVTVHANATLGADGFGYRCEQGRHVKVPHLGCVEIGADVEIGAGATIDRGTFGSTKIGAGTKIDNLVQVGHNCQLGEHVLLAAQVGIGGSCTIGSHAALGGQAGVKDHVHIGAGSIIGAQAGVMGDAPERANLWGTPAFPLREHLRVNSALVGAPALIKEVERLKKHVGLDGAARSGPE